MEYLIIICKVWLLNLYTRKLLKWSVFSIILLKYIFLLFCFSSFFLLLFGWANETIVYVQRYCYNTKQILKCCKCLNNPQNSKSIIFLCSVNVGYRCICVCMLYSNNIAFHDSKVQYVCIPKFV